ncbi:hypothetical protein [Pedobacter mendelii]|uniref:Uncharacterized protein n=1 Tax=Pedobacter mendelii TaxID=1908240 RepID=A0ABQ2BLZ2_9SPHI|nr:hypothetical protein [Pedobacter mendelii]GGI29326.1 hypothetical protein GCM10008119_37070 [Pedobacter mendelii]
MKTTLAALFLSIALFSCKQEKLEKTYTPRDLRFGESFNETTKSKEDVLKISKIDSGKKDGDIFELKFKDTLITILDRPKPMATKFLSPRFLNTQKTAAIAQVADGSGLVSPFYIVALNNGKPEVIKLSRPSNGANDSKITVGLQEVSLSTILINNDYVVTVINGRVFPVKRQNDGERIQGRFLLNSADKSTLVFAMANSLYQVNYLTGETFNLPVSAQTLDPKTILNNIQQNYSWQKNKKGTLFLKENDNNRIIDISEFKK